jgi:hypothetical protein
MVNMDTLGLAPTEIWTSHSDKRLAGALAYIAKQLNVPVTGEDVGQVALTTDAEQFSNPLLKCRARVGDIFLVSASFRERRDSSLALEDATYENATSSSFFMSYIMGIISGAEQTVAARGNQSFGRKVRQRLEQQG